MTSTPGPVPTIDLALADRADSWAATADRIDGACRTGLFLLTGHQIPTEATQTVYRHTRALFEADPAVRRATSRSRSFLGYRGAPDAGSAADHKETFTIGRDPHPGETAGEFTPPNMWPPLPEFQQTLTAHYTRLQAVAIRVGDLLTKALELPPGFLTGRPERHISWLTAINYPTGAHETAAPRTRFGPHRDRGTIALVSATGPGLEVQADDGSWRPVPLTDGALVVIIGSMLAGWTGRRWTAPRHRVGPAAPSETSPRQSLVFFFNPDPATRLEPLPGPGRPHPPPPFGPALTVGDYLRTMIDGYRNPARP
ncbi:2-oxoglutarate and iron-dependent oxygenase domain-containing protein [Actinomadura fulvescens]|uniref:2-oxoglutarate and iron-dependent oxygenase domain-containing protein n=1 Tax=Actinomadura fulvescens TaxID=46160 RepID=A0ABP6CVJ7_9ACTN